MSFYEYFSDLIFSLSYFHLSFKNLSVLPQKSAFDTSLCFEASSFRVVFNVITNCAATALYDKRQFVFNCFFIPSRVVPPSSQRKGLKSKSNCQNKMLAHPAKFPYEKQICPEPRDTVGHRRERQSWSVYRVCVCVREREEVAHQHVMPF